MSFSLKVRRMHNFCSNTQKLKNNHMQQVSVGNSAIRRYIDIGFVSGVALFSHAMRQGGVLL